MNIEKLKRISSALLLTSIIGTSSISLTGCSIKNITTTVDSFDERKNYAVYINNDIAVIYTITKSVRNSGNRIYHSRVNKDQQVILQGELVHYLENYTLEEVEAYARNSINENGIIRYYNVDEKEMPKTLKKTK